MTALHDKLCYAGAMTVLVRCLQQTMTSVVIHWAEVYQLCQLIEMTFRCSHDAAKHSVLAIGTDLITTLFSILASDGIGRQYESPVRVLIRRIGRLELSITDIERHRKLWTCLEHMALLVNQDRVISHDALYLLAGLTTHANSKVYAMASPTFLGSIIKCSTLAAHETETRHEIAKILQNLTLHGSNKSKMTKEIILEQLVVLAAPDQSITTREYAIQAIRHISVEAKGKLFIVTYEAGEVLKTLLNASEVPTLQPPAAETLMSLSCQTTASPMVNFPGLLEMIVRMASSESCKVAEKSAQTIKRLSNHVSMNHRGHPDLFNALLSLSESKSPRVRYWIAKAFLEQSKMSGSSFLLVRSPEASLRISELANDTCSEVQDPAIETLFVLTTYHSNLKCFSMHSNLLDSLVGAVNRGLDGGYMSSLICRNAVLAILNLTKNRCSRKRAAKHHNLISALSKYGVSDDDDEELKQAALHGVIVLSPLL